MSLNRRVLNHKAIHIFRGVGVMILLVVYFSALVGCARREPTARQPGSADPTAQSVNNQSGSKTPFATLPPLPSKDGGQTTLPAGQLPLTAQDAQPAGSSTAPTATPLLDPACLVGSWTVTDLYGAMAESYAQSGSSLTLQTVEGQAIYSFDPSGNMTIQFNHLAAVFNGRVEERDVTAQQALDGSGTAHYQVDQAAGEIILTDFGGEGVVSTIDINGQRLAEGNLPVWSAFTSALSNESVPQSGLVKYSRATVACSGDAMSIQAIEPAPGPVVNLTRVK